MPGEKEKCKILICSFRDKYPDYVEKYFLNLQEIICRLTQYDFRKTFYMIRKLSDYGAQLLRTMIWHNTRPICLPVQMTNEMWQMKSGKWNAMHKIKFYKWYTTKEAVFLSSHKFQAWCQDPSMV